MKIVFLSVLIVLSVSVFASDMTRTVVKINGQPFSVQEIAASYSRAKAMQAEILFPEFLDRFILQQLYIADAKARGRDTTNSFKQACLHYQERIMRKRQTSQNTETEKRFETYLQEQPPKLKVAHILCAVVPQASEQEKALARKRAYRLYARIEGGESFEQLAIEASDDSFSAPNGGLLPAFSRGEFEETFETAAFALEQDGSVSLPVLTPYGWHIIKRIGTVPLDDTLHLRNKFDRMRKRFGPEMEILSPKLTREDSVEIAQLTEEFGRNILIVESQRKYLLPIDEEQLEAYFKENKKKYRLKQPLFKGYVVECTDKKMAKRVKKQLKKGVPIPDIMALSDDWNNDENAVLRIEKGVYLPGQNQTVDKRAFKRKDLVADSVYRNSFVYGKVLKTRPDHYLDVKENVMADWEKWQNTEIKKLLAQKYPVEIDEDVLKTVNFDRLIVF